MTGDSERLEEIETLIALDEAHAEMERGEGRPMEEALPALRDRLGFGRSVTSSSATP